MRVTGPSESHNKHRRPFSKQVQDVIRISDVILETIDARFIKESRIPELEEMIKEQGKMLIHVVNKIDLLSKKYLDENKLKDLSYPILISTKTRQGISKLRERIHILSKKFKDHANVHVGVIGYPNTGKSTLISIMARRAAAPSSKQAGFTKSIRKIRFAKGILLLDAPGIVQSKENLFVGHEDLKKHALLGVHVPETVRNPEFIVSEIMKLHPGRLEKKYGVDAEEDPEVLFEHLGKKWNFLKKKGLVDIDRVSRRILKDWQEAKAY